MTTSKFPVRVWTAAAALGAMFVSTPHALAFEPFDMKVVGGFGNQLQSSMVEEPFFTEELPQAADGKIDITFRRMDEVGLKGFDAMRLLRLGIFDLMEIQLGYVSGDEPFFLGVDMLGVAPDLETARELAEAYRPYFDERLQEKFNGKLLALWPYPGQMFFCNTPMSGIGDFEGKKVRVYTPAMASLVEELGAIGVTLAFPEVYQALQRGVIDCAITGSMAGNTAKWPEVSTHFYPLAIGWGMQAHVANLDFWNSLEPDAREFLAEQIKKMEDQLWELAENSTEDGIECNTGTGECDLGTEYNMERIEVTQEDVERMQRAVREAVLPDWIASCEETYPECAEIWNETGGEITGVKAEAGGKSEG